jgi:hypothetical protein
MDVNCWHILLLRRNLQFFVKGRLVYNAVICQGCLHIQDLSLSLPGIALCVDIYILVSVQNLPDCLFFGNLQLIFSVTQGVYYSNELGLLS